MWQGPPERFEIMNALLNAIPRDADFNSELWTTVDRDRTNVREKAILRLIQVSLFDVTDCFLSSQKVAHCFFPLAGIFPLHCPHGQELSF